MISIQASESKMACILTCPICNMTLKEEGDEMKSSPGEYRIFDSLWNSKFDAGKFRIIQCLSCLHCGSVASFNC